MPYDVKVDFRIQKQKTQQDRVGGALIGGTLGALLGGASIGWGGAAFLGTGGAVFGAAVGYDNMVAIFDEFRHTSRWSIGNWSSH